MDNDDNEFQKEVVQRLTRIETKLDDACKTVVKNTEKIVVLENSDLVGKTERAMLKKIVTAVGGGLGILSTIVGIIGILRGWF